MIANEYTHFSGFLDSCIRFFVDFFGCWTLDSCIELLNDKINQNHFTSVQSSTNLNENQRFLMALSKLLINSNNFCLCKVIISKVMRTPDVVKIAYENSAYSLKLCASSQNATINESAYFPRMTKAIAFFNLNPLFCSIGSTFGWIPITNSEFCSVWKTFIFLYEILDLSKDIKQSPRFKYANFVLAAFSSSNLRRKTVFDEDKWRSGLFICFVDGKYGIWIVDSNN